MTDPLANMPAPADAVQVDDWEPGFDYIAPDGTTRTKMRRDFAVHHWHVPVLLDDEIDMGETVIAIHGFQEDDGEAIRHIRVSIRDEDDDEPIEVARYGPNEARRVAARLLLAAERIDQADDDEYA